MTARLWVAVFWLATFWTSAAVAKNTSILVQSTTSTANSGLYNFLLPAFEQSSGISVNIVAVGTGQAIRNAKNCDADVLLVHAKSAEEQFVADGFGIARHDLMYNDFVIVGPAEDPANINKLTSTAEAFRSIAETKSVFASRGDNSGTHKKEVSLWHSAAVNASADSGKWYRETGSGMGATLNAAVGMSAYTLTDRATWISFGNRQNHTILFEGEPELFNQYGVILVSAEKCPRVKSSAGEKFIDWLTSTEGQHLIDSYQVDGQQLFYSNAQNR
ncbi:sulfate transporter [Chromatiales bacterium (ex Bugula neritina AB1)]|nr:sulfate transporter [Chromatiales bacterium (ex Bugula neritina AB1)]